MLVDIGEEIIELARDAKFRRNLGLVVLLSLVSSSSVAGEYSSPKRLARHEKVEQFFDLVSVGVCIRTKLIMRN